MMLAATMATLLFMGSLGMAGADAMQTSQQAYEAMPDTAGTGPYPAVKRTAPAFPDYVLYQPADLSKLGGKKLGDAAEVQPSIAMSGPLTRMAQTARDRTDVMWWTTSAPA
ncbi:hypothetical protein ACX40Y_09800 [Sphingomonas sp. RS6]